VNANRFLVREDAIHVVFSDGKKARRLFLFNDLLIFARKDWRDKLHVIEKTPLKDIRVCDIAETGDTSETVLVEVEILPSSDFDFPNRYILSLSSTAEKAAWLDAYKCLVRFHVKSKNINDITMTLSSEDKDNDDEEEQRANTKEVVEEALKAKKFQVDDLETANKDLNSKILLLEKIMKERDAKIREWEDKVLEIEANNRKIVSAKDELISQKDATIKELNSNCEQKKSTIAELESKLLLESQKIQKKEALLDAHYKEQIESTQLLETQLKNQKGNYQKQIKVIEELNLELETCKGLLSDEQASNKKLKAKNHELDTQLIEKDSLLNKAETNLIHLQEENHFSVVKCQEILQVLGINWKLPVSQLVFSDNSRINRHKSGYGLNTTPSFEQLSNRGARNIVQSASELLDLTRNCVEDLLKAVNEKQNKLNATQEELIIMTEKHTKAKMELSNYESNLNSSSAQYSNLSHKLTEAENRLQELKRSLDAKQKEFEQMEETNSAQINNQKRSLSEKELKIETLSASLSNETEKARNLSKEIEYYRGQMDDYKNQCGIQKECIQEQLSKLKRLQEDLAQKEKENVELQEKNASNLKIISEVQNLIKKAHSESSLEFEVSGGVIAQVRSFSSAAIELSINTKKQVSELSTNLNGVRSTLAQKTDALCTLEQNFEKKSAELIETTLLLTKRTEKLASLKEELEETKDALLSATNALNQVKHALEQTRANVEHFKLTNASLERQQKQIQLALDESRKEVLDVHERNKQQQVIIQKLSDSVSIAEDKMIQLNVNFREKEIALENALKQGKELEIQNIELEEKQSTMVKRLEVKEQDLKELDQKLHHSLKLTVEFSLI
jgi:chromosome segregation ATPase